MKKLLIVLLIHCIPLTAIGDELVLDEEKARSVIAELSAASQRVDIEHLRKFVDSQSSFVWKTTIEGGTDGKEANGDQWLEFMEFFAPMTTELGSGMQSEIRGIHIDPELNQAVVIEDVISTTSLAGVTYEEQATETTTLGVRNGSIKVIYWERITTKFTETE